MKNLRSEKGDARIPAYPAFEVLSPQIEGVVGRRRDVVLVAPYLSRLIRIIYGKGRTRKDGEVPAKLDIELQMQFAHKVGIGFTAEIQILGSIFRIDRKSFSQ